MAETKKKSSLVKKLVIGALVLAGLAVAAMAAAVYLVDWKALKDKATAEASKKLGRELKVESLSVSLFSGVTLNKVSLANGKGFSKEPLFYNEKAVLRLSLFSLFSGKVVIKEIEFKSPNVLVERDSKGVFNFSGMGSKEAQAAAPAAAKAEKGSKKLPDVMLASLSIKDANFTFKDARKGKTYGLKGLQYRLSGFSLKAGGSSRMELNFTAESEGKKIPVAAVMDFSLDLEGDKLDISSLKLNAPGFSQESSIKVAGLSKGMKIDSTQSASIDLAKLFEALPPSLLKDLPPGVKASGTLKVESKAQGPVSDPMKTLKASVTLKSSGLKVSGLETGALDHALHLDHGQVRTKTRLALYGGDFSEETWLNLAAKDPQFKSQVGLLNLDLKSFVPAYLSARPSSKRVAQLKDKLEGKLSFGVSAKGQGFKEPALYKNLAAEGAFDVKDGVLRKLEAQEKLASKIPHPPTAQALRSDIDFDLMHGDFNIKNKAFNLMQLQISSGKDHREGNLLIQGSGTLQLGGGPLNFKFIPHFNPSVVKLEGIAAEGFNDEAGWATYDYLGYAGPNADSAKADYKAGARKAATKVLQKQIDQQKQRLQEEGKKQLEEKGKDLMKNLFGK